MIGPVHSVGRSKNSPGVSDNDEGVISKSRGVEVGRGTGCRRLPACSIGRNQDGSLATRSKELCFTVNYTQKMRSCARIAFDPHKSCLNRSLSANGHEAIF